MDSAPHSDDYTKYTVLSFPVGRQVLRVISKPGLPDWNSLLPAESLLMETVQPAADSQAVLLGCHHGALAVHLSAQITSRWQLTVADTDWLALECTRRSLALNQSAHLTIQSSLDLLSGLSGTSGPSTLAGQVDTLVMLPPRGRVLGRTWLALSADLLKPGGQLYLAGANEEGIQSLIKDAESLFGACRVLAYRKGSRVALSVRPAECLSPAWLAEPGMKPGTYHVQEFALPGIPPLTLHSLPGTFSYEHLDSGSALLLAHLQTILSSLPAGASVLDVGCGYGIIGLSAARLLPGSTVALVDIDLAALHCAQLNIAHNAIPNAQCFPSDLLDACGNQRYHLVLSNPPFHAGKRVSYSAAETLIAQSRQLLHPGGSLVLVANRFLRYEKTMRDFFPKVEVLAENSQFHLLRAVNTPQGKRRER